MVAVMGRNQQEFLQALLEAHADPNFVDGTGIPPLHRAIMQSLCILHTKPAQLYVDCRMCQVLLDARADVNKGCHRDGLTPLYMALCQAKEPLWKLFLDYGADPFLKGAETHPNSQTVGTSLFGARAPALLLPHIGSTSSGPLVDTPVCHNNNNPPTQRQEEELPLQRPVTTLGSKRSPYELAQYQLCHFNKNPPPSQEILAYQRFLQTVRQMEYDYFPDEHRTAVAMGFGQRTGAHSPFALLCGARHEHVELLKLIFKYRAEPSSFCLKKGKRAGDFQ